MTISLPSTWTCMERVNDVWQLTLNMMPVVQIPFACMARTCSRPDYCWPFHITASVQDHLGGHQVGAEGPEQEALLQDQIRSLHRAVEEAAAEMARREAVRRRPAGSLLFDDTLTGAARPSTFESYAEGVCDLTDFRESSPLTRAFFGESRPHMICSKCQHHGLKAGSRLTMSSLQQDLRSLHLCNDYSHGFLTFALLNWAQVCKLQICSQITPPTAQKL